MQNTYVFSVSACLSYSPLPERERIRSFRERVALVTPIILIKRIFTKNTKGITGVEYTA